MATFKAKKVYTGLHGGWFSLASLFVKMLKTIIVCGTWSCLRDILNVPVFFCILSDLCSDYLSCSVSSDLNTNQSWCEFPFLKFHAFRTLAILTQALPTRIKIFIWVKIRYKFQYIMYCTLYRISTWNERKHHHSFLYIDRHSNTVMSCMNSNCFHT